MAGSGREAARDESGIDAIGLGFLAQASGEALHLRGIEQVDRKTRLAQRGDRLAFIAARGFKRYGCIASGAKALNKTFKTRLAVGNLKGNGFGVEENVEACLRYVDADKGLEPWHDQIPGLSYGVVAPWQLFGLDDQAGRALLDPEIERSSPATASRQRRRGHCHRPSGPSLTTYPTDKPHDQSGSMDCFASLAMSLTYLLPSGRSPRW
jgi:hypothetical protein